MKTQMGVGLAVLSVLAAEGKDFSREELNAMLDKLAALPEPKVRRGPQAMCYSPECEEWMHFVRHDYLPEMCADCARSAKCLGGCREAARVFSGSPCAPDPLFAKN